MIISLELRMATRCPMCSVLTPMAGLRNSLSCRNCAAVIDYAKRAAEAREGGLRYWFGGYYDAVAEAAIMLQDGQDCANSEGTVRRAPPTCVGCNAALPLPAPGATEITCPGCADRIAVRWPDDETRAWDPRIQFIVGDGKGRGNAGREVQREGTLVSCSHCGAPLAQSDGDRRRSRTCTHCGGVNYLADAAWLALYPQPEWHRFHLVYSIDERALLALHEWLDREESKYFYERGQKAARKAGYAQAKLAARGAMLAALGRGDVTKAELEVLAADAALTDAEAGAVDARLDNAARKRVGLAAAPTLARRFAQCSAAEVRLVAAQHASSDASILERLSADTHAPVRAAVAARAETPATALARLRKDADAHVVETVKRNPAYQPGFFEKIFG